MVTNVRDAKARLSHLIQMAAEGEEIVITVRGEPAARLTGVKRAGKESVGRSEWAAELRATAEAARVGAPKATGQEFWDELREERL